ncbi:MAG: DNA polymerase-3 subunit gamma/tau [Lysobacterales bacterium]|jgi:DNA polymerase-3 subunit gamma/tau
MDYLVLARKHRPTSFDSLIGQDHITTILKEAIKAERIAHAYLFCGPRGVGKTSCARILAQCLNCEDGPKINPSEDDPMVQAIAKGNSFDVLEIDGASNRGIDEIRSLRENVKFAPTASKYKIYIIDEVHMLTTEAFNALLKTLEEPPPHVKFIFATTESHKLPATIISRCQKFDFKHIGLTTIIDVLKGICVKEDITIDQDALYAIAKAAQGSMRDGLSILDQLSALSAKGIVSDDVYSMLGLVEVDLLFNITNAIAQKDCGLAFEILEEITDKGKDVKQLVKDLVDHLRHLMVIKVGGKKLGKLVDYPIAVKEDLLVQAEKFELSDILNALDVFIKVQDTARITEGYRIPLEIALAKLTQTAHIAAAVAQPKTPKVTTPQPAASTAPVVAPKPQTRIELSIAKKAVNLLKDNKGQAQSIPGIRETTTASKKAEVIEEVVLPEVKAVYDGIISLDAVIAQWDAFTHNLSKKRMLIATYLQEAKPYKLVEDLLSLGFIDEFIFNKEALEDQEKLTIVQDELSEYFKSSVAIEYKMIDDGMNVAVDENDNIKSVLNAFSGEVTNKWHKE